MAFPGERTLPLLACAATLLHAGGAGASGTIMPLGDESVEMIDERLVLHASGKVKAVYTFWNATGKEVTIPVGLPELHAPDGTASLTKIRVSVNGEKAELRSEKPGCPATEEGCPDELHVFDVAFPSKQNVTVKCTYEQAPAVASTGEAVLGFALATGRAWKGDIGNFNLYVTIPGHVCQPLAVTGRLIRPGGQCGDAEGPETIEARKGEISPWKDGTAFSYAVKATEKGTRLNIWAQDFEPAGDVSVLVPQGPEPCLWDESLVTGPLEKTCLYSQVIAAKKDAIEKLAAKLGPERARACRGLPDYLLEGGAVFGRSKYGGVDTAIIEKHHAPDGINRIPLYMKSGMVPGLKTFAKKLKKILAQLPV